MCSLVYSACTLPKDNVHLGQDIKLQKDEANFKFGIIVHNIDFQLFLGFVLFSLWCFFVGGRGVNSGFVSSLFALIDKLYCNLIASLLRMRSESAWKIVVQVVVACMQCT